MKGLIPFISKGFDLPSEGAIPTSNLSALYEGFNGGLFWGGALLIRPHFRVAGAPLSVPEWNEPALWKDAYDQITSGIEFFAEDVFGVQFGVREAKVVQFDPETAEISVMSDDVHGWCREIVREPRFYTGSQILEEWERHNGSLPLGFRLLPKQLFMLGGEFESINMVAKPEVEGMRIRAQFWKLTRDLPDGQKVVFRLVE